MHAALSDRESREGKRRLPAAIPTFYVIYSTRTSLFQTVRRRGGAPHGSPRAMRQRSETA